MSEHPELTPAIRAELHTALLRRQADLQRQIAYLRRNERTPTDQVDDAVNKTPGDAADSSVDLQDWDDTHQLILDLHAHLGEVEHALGKFDTGTYGLCERCGRLIPLARLRIVPAARYDVEHEEAVEAGRAPR
jgi:DnaK suppressor protein